MDEQRLQQLLEKHRTNHLTDEEWQQLRPALLDDDHVRQIEAGIELQLRTAHVHNPWSPELEQRIWAGIVRGTRPWYRIPLYRMTAAAACLVALIGLFQLRNHIARKTSPIVNSATKSPAAKHSRAMLTLGDGTTIALESAANGTLAQQGDQKVLKAADGRLVYDKTGSGGTASLYNTIETPRGGVYQITLSDGTKVWLNAASSLRYPTEFTGDSREVELNGEAFFDVKKALRPFRVKAAGNMEVQVLGTAFNCMAYEDESAIRTTLVEGAVNMSNGTMVKKLQPGEQAAWKPGAATPYITRPDLSEVLAWKEGEFRFHATDIATIMRQLTRWYDVDIQYPNGIPDFTFSGNISRRENVTQLLEAIELTGGVHFKLEGKKIVVSKDIPAKTNK